RDSIREIFLFQISTHIDEWKHGDRRTLRCGTLGCRDSRFGWCRLFGQVDTVNTNRPRDILDRLLAQIVELETQLVLHLVMNDTGHHDPTWVCQCLEARRNVDAISINIVAINDNVTDVDADTELNAFL